MPSLIRLREVEEQLAEALPVLGRATLNHALVGLNELLSGVAAPPIQHLLIWLWTESHGAFGQVSVGPEGAGLRIWLPSDGFDIRLAYEATALAVAIDPIVVGDGTYAITTAAMRANPRECAFNLLKYFEKRCVKSRRHR